MNIAFFLVPKANIIYIYNDYTMRQAMEKLEHHHYSAVPILNKEGKYMGAITAADLLWKIKNSPELNAGNWEKIYIDNIPRSWDPKPVNVDAKIQDLLDRAMNQNFIPVVDDLGVFIGIVRRREIIEFCAHFFSEHMQDISEAEINKFKDL